MTPAIANDADRRLAAIQRDLELAGRFYPRQAVLDALRYWKLPSSASIEQQGLTA